MKVSNGMIIESSTLRDIMLTRTTSGKFAATLYTSRIAKAQTRYRVYGQTEEGRYLFVVIERLSGTIYKPITARDMTEGEKSGYRRLRR